MQESPKKISRKDRGRLDGGLFSAIAMVALTVSGAGLASWYIETADQGQFGGVFEAEATTLSFSAETVATLPSLEVDFQDALPAKAVVRKIGTLRRIAHSMQPSKNSVQSGLRRPPRSNPFTTKTCWTRAGCERA